MIYETIFKKLSKIIDFTELKDKTHLKFKSKGFMDLNFDYLGVEDDGCFKIAMSHNYIQNGDLMCDPDMEILIHQKIKMAEALTCQQDNLGIYRAVYSEDRKNVNLIVKRELNDFLNKWLSNVLKQNYILSN